MQSQNRLLDDLARVASGALGVAAGMRGEVEARLREQFERLITQMDLVTREEFDAVQAMAAKARSEQEVLAARLAELEARLPGPSARPGKAKNTGTARKAGGKPAKSTRGRNE